MLPIASSALEVILLARPQGSFLSGVAPEIIDINIPVLIPAPQAPQNPHTPPGSIGGPRCCKRDSYMAIISAIDYVAENFNIKMEKLVIKCIHSDKNNQCIKERCPFHE